MNVEGTINQVDFKGYSYRDIQLNGHYDTALMSGQFAVDDPNLRADLTAEIRHAKQHDIHIEGTIGQLALKALHHLPDDISLVLVGRHTAYTDKLTQYARTNGLEHRLRILHGVPDADLPALYADAEAFVYPSVYEGFGIPIIEAIRCGLPILRHIQDNLSGRLRRLTGFSQTVPAP